jgi:Leucine-rich repeat (LRR) protein
MLFAAVLLIALVIVNCGHVPGREGKCEFSNEHNPLLGNVYGCKIRNAILQKDEKFILTGTHLSKGRKDLGVKFVEFTSSNISHIPEQLFRKFSNLQYLSMNAAGLKHLYPIANASDLKVILANNNRIVNLVAYTFITSGDLEILSFRQNHINEIDLNAFKNLSNLRELYLADNKISMLHMNTFNPLISLEILSLSGNQIQSIDLELFQSNLQLREILFYDNKLSAVHPQSFGNLKSLFNLELHGNLCIDSDIRVDDEVYQDKINRMLTNCFDNYPLQKS